MAALRDCRVRGRARTPRGSPACRSGRSRFRSPFGERPRPWPKPTGYSPGMDITNPQVEEYTRGLLGRLDEPVLLEMEAHADTIDFPAVGRLVGPLLELLARGIGARRVFELGSGFGYSAYWFARAVGS